jgi:hypothetical protein
MALIPARALEGFDGEIIEALDTAWKKLLEARELLTYAAGLIENTTERERINLVQSAVRRATFALINVACVWDTSPILKKVREANE